MLSGILTNWLRRLGSSLTAEASAPVMEQKLSPYLYLNIEKLHALFTDTPDLVIREFRIEASGAWAALVFLEGLTNQDRLNERVLVPLIQGHATGSRDLPLGHMDHQCLWSDVQHTILQGNSVLFVHGLDEAAVLRTSEFPQRAVLEPRTETSLKGAHTGFVESIEQNIALVRQYFPHREFKIRNLNVGRRSDTRVSLLYLADVANLELLEEMERRLRKLDLDLIINTGELAELIEDNPYSPFPQLLITERPDTTAKHIGQGRIAIVVDRSPSVILAPVSFTTFFQNIDDYSTRWSIASLIRILRFFAFGIAVCLPAIYIAVISYNFELIPLKLLFTIGQFRGNVPFPPFLEAMFMEVTLEMMREAGVRLPSPVGQTIGIVGGIVIGQAVVQAGLISNIMVIIVAFTAISSFILPNYDMVGAVRILRFMMMVMAALFGMFGIIIGMMTLLGHMLALESMGTPYGTPLAPMRFADWRDTFIRAPLRKLTKRPTGARPADRKRQNTNMSERE